MGKNKTARFTAVVQKAGRPETYLLWQDPKKDPVFQSALEEKRLMTVLREAKGKEYGLAGFKRSKAASYLVFPKSLAGFEGRRVVGIKYEQFAPSKPVGKRVQPLEQPAPRKPETPKPKAGPKQYEVRVRVEATAEQTFVVDAQNRTEAEQAALVASEERGSDLGGAKFTRRIAKVRTV